MARVKVGIVKLDINGRIRIPAELREKFGWRKGQLFEMELDEETKQIILTPIKGTKLVAITEKGEEVVVSE